MKTLNNRLKSGFTLVEMLIVLAVLGILIGLLTPAILKNVKIANEKSHENERRVLQAAIMEYWHDQKEWPIKEGDKPNKKNNYKLSYREKNYEVFGKLIEADFGGVKGGKDYLDLGRHTTTATKGSTFPAFAAITLRDAVEEQKRDDNVLVYWADAIECPHCKEYFDIGANGCNNDDCPYLDKGEGHYKFVKKDKKDVVRSLKPYGVTIDFNNNTVDVYE